MQPCAASYGRIFPLPLPCLMCQLSAIIKLTPPPSTSLSLIVSSSIQKPGSCDRAWRGGRAIGSFNWVSLAGRGGRCEGQRKGGELLFIALTSALGTPTLPCPPPPPSPLTLWLRVLYYVGHEHRSHGPQTPTVPFGVPCFHWASTSRIVLVFSLDVMKTSVILDPFGTSHSSRITGKLRNLDNRR